MELGAPIDPLPKAPQQSQESSLSPPPPVVHQPQHAPPPPVQPSPSRFSQSAIPRSQPSQSTTLPPQPTQSSHPVQPPQPPSAPSTAPVQPPFPIALQPHPNTPRRKVIDLKGKGKATANSDNPEDEGEPEPDQGGPFAIHVHRYAPFTGEKQQETLAVVSKALDGLYAFAKENNLDPTVVGKCFNQQLTSTTKMSAWQAIQRLWGAEHEGVGKCLKS